MTALLRLSVRLARKEELASTTVQSLRILLAMKPGSIFHVSRQVRAGNSQNGECCHCTVLLT